MNRLYVRCESEADFAELRGRFPRAALEPPSSFASIPASSITPDLPAALCRLSDELQREVILLFFSSVTDSLQFTHVISGQLLRHLQYGVHAEQGLWEEVLGTAEDWEKAAFFGRAMPTPQDEQERDELVAIYSRGQIASGQYHPIIDARESARAAAVEYRLTDWLDDWQTRPRDAIALPAAVPKQVKVAVSQEPRPDQRQRKRWWQFWQ